MALNGLELDTAEAAMELYRGLVRIRAVEEHISRLYPQQQMRCPVHLCVGQEAVPVGVAAALEKRDYVLSGHRSHGHYLAKGGDLRQMIAEIYGRTTGCCEGKGGSMHLVDLSVGVLGAVPIVGSTIPIAVGTALGSVMQGEDRVTAVFFGDAALEEGVFHESVAFAALRRLPVLFVCENNFFSVQTPLSARQPEGRAMTDLARAHGVPAVSGDGNDVVEVLGQAREAVARARAGEGPTLLVYDTYRWLEHVGPYPDHDLGYRTAEEIESWRRRCPVEKLGARLEAEGWATAEARGEIRAEIDAEVEAAFAFAQGSPFPTREALLEHVYPPARKER